MNGNILLINPAVNPSSQRKIINSVINATFPTSLGSIAGFLISQGVTPIHIIDEQLNFVTDQNLPGLILSLSKPRIIGLSILTINSKRAYELSRKIKNIDPEALIVAGGIHPTVLPEEALDSKRIDVVVRGEGELTFLELVNSVNKGAGYKTITGISWKKDGSIIHNPDRAMVMDLDTLAPFPYHLFAKDLKRYPSFGGILTSRGCPFGCIFCSSRSISGRKYRYFSIKRVISEIKLLVNTYNQQTIWLMDDNIAAERKRFLDLLSAIKQERFPQEVHFHGSMRGDNIDDEILDKAKEANFKMISFGLETGSESLMKLIDKAETVKEVADAIKKTADKGIAVASTIIFGLPAETRKDRRDTIRMVNALPLASIRYNILTPYPGTPVFDMLNKSGELLIKRNWENFAVQYMWESSDIPYVPKGNNKYELIFDTMFANLAFYLSYKGVRRMLRSSFAGGNVIKMSQKWYLSPRTLWNFTQVTFYLILRFANVTFWMLISKTTTKNTDKYLLARGSLESIIKFNADIGIPASSPTLAVYKSYLAKTYENILYERYAGWRRPFYTYLPLSYQIIPAPLRYRFQGLFKQNPALSAFPSWPFERSLEKLREIAITKYSLEDSRLFKNPGWPRGKQCALILTHDIENEDNWEWVKKIALIESELGLRSSWNVVPKLYKIDYSVLDWLKENGFEIGLHGYNHDNKLAYLDETRIHTRFKESKGLIKDYDIKGFRAASWLRSDALFKALEDYFIYDSSVLDVDYISPAGAGGCCSIFPFQRGRIVELPVTLPYELPIQFGAKREELNSFWRQKIDWIKKTGGMINIITHPDPFYGGNETMVNMYQEFLRTFQRDKEIICLLPAQAAMHFNASI